MSRRPQHAFNRVNRQLPCPVCNHDGWCLVSPFGDRAICCRVESDSPATAFDGWFHAIPPRQRPSRSHVAKATKPVSHHDVIDLSLRHQTHVERFGPSERNRAAASLSLDPCAFDPFPIGYDPITDALAIPSMQVGHPAIVGIRYRRIDPKPGGLKWICEPGSTAGLLLPHFAPTSDAPIVLCEGPSDTFAATQLGLHAVGRWSCGLDARQAATLASHVAAIAHPTILVVGDNDEGLTGKRGADAAAKLVAETLPHAVVQRVQPPDSIKDLRAWVLNGATAAEVLEVGSEVRRGS